MLLPQGIHCVNDMETIHSEIPRGQFILEKKLTEELVHWETEAVMAIIGTVTWSGV